MSVRESTRAKQEKTIWVGKTSQVVASRYRQKLPANLKQKQKQQQQRQMLNLISYRLWIRVASEPVLVVNWQPKCCKRPQEHSQSADCEPEFKTTV